VRLAERLRAKLAGTPITPPDGPTLQLTASFGIACAEPRNLIDLDGLFREADRALYAAKAEGRNRVCRNDAPMRLGAG